jgi:hypothetical protein
MKMAVPAKKVGEVAVRRTLKKRMIIVPGTLATVSSVVIRALPRRMVVGFYDKVSR